MKKSLAYPIIGLIILVALSITISLHFVSVGSLEAAFKKEEDNFVRRANSIVESLIKEDADSLSDIIKTLKQHLVLKSRISDNQGGRVGHTYIFRCGYQ